MSFIQVEFGLLRPSSKLPTYGSVDAAYADIYVALPEGQKWLKIPLGATVGVPTGLFIKSISKGARIDIRPRSGLSLNTSLRVANSPGTIDGDYKQEIFIPITHVPYLRWDPKWVCTDSIWYENGIRQELPPEDLFREHYSGQQFPFGDVFIKNGTRIAQMAPDWVQRFEFPNQVSEDLPVRQGGFCSTGL